MVGGLEPLSDAELFALGEDEALDRVLDLVALQNRVTAELTRAVRSPRRASCRNATGCGRWPPGSWGMPGCRLRRPRGWCPSAGP